MTAPDEAARERAVESALARLDLAARIRLVDGLDMWSLPALPEIGLRPLVMSDGPVGVRGTVWSAGGPTVMLPSPTALAASWDPDLARRAGRLLAQEARRKGVHVLLAPTVNLHRSPLGGRHFECYSEDPLLTGEIAAGCVAGLQEGGVAATVKHFVANDAETDRFTVDVRVDERALRELYLAPFDVAVRRAGAWAVMSAYNGVNGSPMTEHAALQRQVLKEEWGFDGCLVSDWLAARSGVRAALGGLDVAMPGVVPVFRAGLAEAVRDGKVPETAVADMARRTLRLAARAGALDGAAPAVAPAALPPEVDGAEVAREVAERSFVLLRNDGVLPLDPAALRRVAVAGGAARAMTAMGGGSAEVGQGTVVSALAGLRAALPDGVSLTYAPGASPRTRVPPAVGGFVLGATFRDGGGRALHEQPMASGLARWLGDLPGGVDPGELRSVEVAGTFTPEVGGAHRFAIEGAGTFRLEVAGGAVFDGVNPAGDGDLAASFLSPPVHVVEVELAAGTPVAVSLRHDVEQGMPFPFVNFALGHAEPAADPEALLAEAAAAAASADVAIVVVGTTEETEREGADRVTLALPGRQDELVRRVAAANPRTVVVVNAGSPVEMPWAAEVAAVLLAWFPGQEGGEALARVLLGAVEPGGRLPTTWPARLADCPVSAVTPVEGVLAYDEGLLIGYRAWERAPAPPAFWFGHGLGYTTWTYESAAFTPAASGGELGVLRVRVRNDGPRAGREVVQAYLAPSEPVPDRPRRWLAGFATVSAAPGEAAEAEIALRRRSAETWDVSAGAWRLLTGGYAIETGRTVADRRLTIPIEVTEPG